MPASAHERLVQVVQNLAKGGLTPPGKLPRLFSGQFSGLNNRKRPVNDISGLLIANPEHLPLDLESGFSLDLLQKASIACCIAIGAHAGRRPLALCSVPPLGDVPNNRLLVRLEGFSRHAATVCVAHQRSHLELLCRYITRLHMATKCLSVMVRGASSTATCSRSWMG